MIRRYFDHNATTPLGDAARARLEELLGAREEAFGNPSSLHQRGRAARQLVETARAEVAALVGTPAEAVVFTASGSEAAALGVLGLARRRRATDPMRDRVLVGATEHPSVLGAAEALAEDGYIVVTLPVRSGGDVDLEVAAALLDARTALVCVQHANHETGALQPIALLAARARAVGAWMFCDAVQAAGKIPVDLASLGVAALGLSAHKLYGMKGAGALVLAPEVDLEPVIPGGHQERGRRAGTEAVLALAAFGAAAREAAQQLDGEAVRQEALRRRLEAGLSASGAHIFAAQQARVPNTTLCAWPGVPGQLAMIALDLGGFEVSTGAACSSGSVRPSAVLLAAGHPAELAAGALRISLGRGTNEGDVDALLDALPAILTRIRAASA